MNQNVMNNDFLLGILKKSKKKKKAIEENERNNSNLVNQLLKIKESIRRQNNVSSNLQEKMKNEVNNTKNKNQNQTQNTNEENKKTFKNLLVQIIKKLEDDVDKVTKQIQSYNQEKKNIVELDQKEIKKLKKIIIKLYKTIMEIYGAFDVDRNQRIEMLEKIRMNLETNHILLKNIDEIEKITGYIPSVKKEKEEEEEETVVQEVMNQPQPQSNMNVKPMGENQSNLTIFNLINKGVNKKNNTNTKNNNKNKTSLVNNMVSVVQEITGTKPPENEEEVQEDTTSLQDPLFKEKKEKINMSKKVSKKLNEIPRITNNTARTELNQFLMERLGRTNLYTQTSSNVSTNGPTQPNRSRNQNIFI
jgi:hypothetical protein